MADRRVFTVTEAAEATGYSEETIRRHIRKGNLKAVGGGEERAPYRISKVELAKWWRDQGGGELFDDG